MDTEEFSILMKNNLDLFSNSEEEFKKFCSSLGGNLSKIRSQLKSLRNEGKSESYVFRNFNFWKTLISNFPKTNFPKVSGSPRYFYDRQGKRCFKYKFFVSDFLEAKAMMDCPENPSARYSMLKTELIKYLQKEKKKPIKSKVNLNDDKQMSKEQNPDSLLTDRWSKWMER